MTGESASDDAPQKIRERLAEWARGSMGSVRKMDQELRRRISSRARLKELEDVLSPALVGDELGEEALSRDAVRSEAKCFALARRYFRGDLEDLWTELETSSAILLECYSTETVTRDIGRLLSEDDLPEPETVRSLVERANEVRLGRLETLHSVLLGQELPGEHPERAVKQLAEGIGAQGGEMKREFQALEETFGQRLPLETVWSLVARASADPETISATDFEAEAVLSDVLTLARARELARPDASGATLWGRLTEAVEDLQEDHPDSPLLKQGMAAIKAPGLPKPKSVERLLNQVEEAPDEAVDEEDGGEERLPEGVGQQLDALSEGAFVAIVKGES